MIYFLLLGFHSTEMRMNRVLHLFPELANIDQGLINDVCEESKMYQLEALRALNDLQRSYKLCWTVQITKQCAQMLLKHESIAVIRLYETGMLDESEYSHICEMIKEKVFDLEYGNVQLPAGRKKIIEKSLDILSTFRILPENERIYWKSLMKSKHRWLEPDDILIEQGEIVSVAYLIVRGIVECKEENITTYYTSGNIVGIDVLFSPKDLSESQFTYRAGSGLVELYVIDSILLDTLLADEKIARDIYTEIALQTLINNYLLQYKHNHKQLKLLLNEKAILFRNNSDSTVRLRSNDRIFLLAGTLIPSSDAKEDSVYSPWFNILDSSESYRLNSTSIVFKWNEEDELNYLSTEHGQDIIRLAHSQSIIIDTLYPRYSHELIELAPRHQYLEVTPPVRRFSHLQFVPFELGDYDKFSYPLEPPKL